MKHEDAQVPPADAGRLETPVRQHTPGPWRVQYGQVRAADAILADLHTWDNDTLDVRAEAAANARLIAAAPDLLNALRSLLRHTERVNDVLAQECGVRFVDDGPLGMARDALKTAVGDA